ncbi:MAG: rod shape-determining protein MreC [SAR324 cluster bacterium]|nr:rod shape-determining protein MreC [SAR324 cluster bacterium]
MFDLIKKHRLLLAIIITTIGALIYLFEVGKKPENSRVSTLTQTLTFPIQMLVHTVISFSADITESYFYLVELRKENNELKKQISALTEEVNRYIEESIQYNRLKVQLEFAEQNPDKKIFAEVIGESIDNFHQTLQINRGSEHGVKRNFAVILKEGVVGRIETVTPYQSTVQLILDRRSRFPAILQRTRTKGLVYGNSNGLELRRIPLRGDVKEGDRVVTNGLSGLFPKGVLVGIVKEISHNDHELFQTATLKPVVEFDNIEGVFVVLKSVSQLRQPLFSDK